ncbi:transcriptional regulator [Synechococcales cyanobacterium C]|uniref:Transcriptional regulator n=1 Tax=Petrachloros mirabilis ULC683 TaxID=2781853 RepID=A0A8K2A7M9_9CYAN|nr:transcriptional regulator [Petrachloros mirabilis]NCJ06125.1 transcriptional regulator [Petrachloros mirabilis ULC683]
MTTTLDRQIYASLLGQVQPKVIESEEENELFLAEVDKLMAVGEDLTPEQLQLMNLLVFLIEQFEDQHYQLRPASPLDVLEELMAQRELKQKDLVHLFGSQGVASEVLNGKRAISKVQAKALGDFFHTDPALFLDL